MYRCGLCSQPSGRGEPRRVHVVYRMIPGPGPKVPPRKQIQEEIPVCRDCDSALRNGASPVALRREAREHAARLASVPVQNVPTPSTTKSMVRTVERAAPPKQVAILGVPVKTGGRTVAVSKAGQSAPNGTQPKKAPPFLRCDVCKGPIGEGQVTPESMVCERCAKKAREATPPPVAQPPAAEKKSKPPDPRVRRRSKQ